MVPPMIIQPFVENSIVHGISNLKEGGIVDIIFSIIKDYLMVEIIDNGIGFDVFTNNIKDILHPYFTTKKYGTGLGLSIVNKILNDHNGKIEFIKINNGAKVEIIFNLNDS